VIKELFIDENIHDHPQVKSIRSHLPLPITMVSTSQAVFEHVLGGKKPIERAKHILHLTRNKTDFLRKCPGTREYTCCDYKILHIGNFCTMDCSYCILQTYFHPPVLQYFVNHDDLAAQMDAFTNSVPGISRVGTGEYTDSLIWEPWTDVTPLLISKFAKQKTAILELKTKTVAIERLKSFQHNRKTIVAWSLNTPRIITTEERRTASLKARLRAAARCERWGYPIAFHFDPIVCYPGWESDYRETIQEIFTHVSADNIVWISLGTFRFMPALKAVIQRRFKNSCIVYGEFIRGLDGKMRYFKPLRINIYRKLIAWIREMAPQVCLYFCMEDDEVWEKAMGFMPSDRGGLPKMLDEAAIRHCGLTL
jgi:spore photoproduct lyase